MKVTQLTTTDIQDRLRNMMYSITVAAFREKGENRRDLLKIRDEIRSLLKKKNLDREEIVKELGFILIGLAILIDSIKDKVTKRSLIRIIDDFSS